VRIPTSTNGFVAHVTADCIYGCWDASEDQGATWRQDFDLIFERIATGPAG
jgi:hypothetical protein